MCPVQLQPVIHHLHHRPVTSHVNHPRVVCVCVCVVYSAAGGCSRWRLSSRSAGRCAHGGGSVHRKMLDWSAGPRRTTIDNRLYIHDIKYIYILLLCIYNIYTHLRRARFKNSPCRLYYYRRRASPVYYNMGV